jgi:hypothetical protein
MMGVLRWRHDLRSEAAAQQQQEQQQQRAGPDRSAAHNGHAHAFPKLLSQVSPLSLSRVMEITFIRLSLIELDSRYRECSSYLNAFGIEFQILVRCSSVSTSASEFGDSGILDRNISE